MAVPEEAQQEQTTRLLVAEAVERILELPAKSGRVKVELFRDSNGQVTKVRRTNEYGAKDLAGLDSL